MIKRIYLAFFALLLGVQAFGGNVKGRVLADGKPFEGVWVTDGEVFCRTNALGRYEFDSSKRIGMVFLEIPSGYVPESRDGLRPQFWQYLNFPVDKEEVHDFNLRSEDQSRYTVLLPTDFHLTNDSRKKDLAQFSALVTPVVRRMVSEAEGPVYTFHPGDFTGDEAGFTDADGVRFLQDQRWPTLFFSASDNPDCFGPYCFSWNIGGDHWVFLGSTGLTTTQLEWLHGDLSHQDKDAKIYFCQPGSSTDETTKKQLDMLTSAFTGGFTRFGGRPSGDNPAEILVAEFRSGEAPKTHIEPLSWKPAPYLGKGGAAASKASVGNVKGRVLCDGQPVAGVKISDGYIITLTGSDGRYEMLSSKKDGMVFIMTPEGYTVPLKDGLRPDFWQYLSLPFEQEEIHDFVLIKQDQTKYRMILPTDVHLAGDARRDILTRFVSHTLPLFHQLHEVDYPVFSTDLGDFTHDFYWYDTEFREMEGLLFYQNVGVPGPMYAVAGNHDHDPSITNVPDVDWEAGWMQRQCWGPNRYSADIGGDHWIFLDNMFYINNAGKGKKGKGLAGDRKCPGRFRPEQLDWLEKDLSMLPSDTRLYMCVHDPLMRAHGRNSDIPAEQMQRIEDMVARFSRGVTVFAGHLHKWETTEMVEYPHIHSHGLPATSGDMWETLKDWKVVAGDGSDAGLAYLDFEKGKEPSYHFNSYKYGEQLPFRVYDLNEVGKAYREEPAVQGIRKKYPDHPDYGDSEYKNIVLVNYWQQKPGDTVELYEKGKKREGQNSRIEDPTYFFAWEVQVFHKRIDKGLHKKGGKPYVWEFQTRSAKTPVTIVIKDKDGKVLYKETFQRPIPFDPSGKSESSIYPVE